MDNAIEYFSKGNGAHTFCVIDSNKGIFEMLVRQGAVISDLDKYDNSNYTILMAKPKFLSHSQKLGVCAQLKNMVSRGVKYDYKGILGQLLKVPYKFNARERYYCSEAVALAYWDVVRYSFCGYEPMIVTPADMEYDVRTRQDMWELSFLRDPMIIKCFMTN